ncbi:hypothetical protein [Pseudanabaena yagii]|uniref:Transposase DDE domain-containing protein n=1 Tax=Pseudanabaena yagii GIHE-NHR1 TaxID=2722753 RepID=A0ABX1LT37_9CYAN|nr:hypothetical protein [Pseudanabaena yagii]NMF58675.1 hypothetical protein [Pseudanabaena yagii GIHE-NHR1]
MAFSLGMDGDLTAIDPVMLSNQKCDRYHRHQQINQSYSLFKVCQRIF